MESTRNIVRAISFGLILVGVGWSVSVADARVRPSLLQIATAQQVPAPATGAGTPVPDVQQLRLEEQRAQLANDERQKRLQADSDRLVMLAAELKEEVNKSSRNELSVKALKKATEIEKLAHDVRDRLKQ
jgi:hypothetical protein